MPSGMPMGKVFFMGVDSHGRRSHRRRPAATKTSRQDAVKALFYLYPYEITFNYEYAKVLDSIRPPAYRWKPSCGTSAALSWLVCCPCGEVFRAASGRIILCGLNPVIREILAITKLEDYFELANGTRGGV